MLNKQPPISGGKHYINNQPPKAPSRFLWRMEAVFIFLSVLTVIVLATLLYLSASNNKKAQEASTLLNYNKGLNTQPDDSQTLAKNEPAVVRIAAAYCPNFDLRLGTVTQNFSGACSAGYGSGFIVSPEGYIATNGHVVKASVGEVLSTSIELGNLTVIKSYLNFLTKANLVSQATANDFYSKAAAGDKDAIKSISSSLSDSSLGSTEVKENSNESVYAIQLSDEAVVFDPKNLKSFNYDQNIVKAKLIDINYDPYANIPKDGFTGSDVAILKIDSGSNYPFNRLGSILGVGQGSKLTVVGFPGSAENELVSKDQSLPTATQGTVSSIRNANGTSNKLIQTDTSIAKGNSGGPAYDSAGEVVGLATYKSSDGSDGNTKINYMRDIQDIKDLLSKDNIQLPKESSGIQKLWEQGLAKFSKAYYTSAIADFKRLKAEYPQNRLVDNFIARAEDAKSKGKEATNPDLYLLLIGASIVFIIIPTLILFYVIRHHHKRRDKHNEYIKSQIKNDSAQEIIKARQAQKQAQSQPTAQRRSVNMLSHAQEPPKKL